MRPPCAARAKHPAPGVGRQQVELVIGTDAHPRLELAAARVLLVVLDELRSEGIVVHQVALELDGDMSGPGWWGFAGGSGR